MSTCQYCKFYHPDTTYCVLSVNKLPTDSCMEFEQILGSLDPKTITMYKEPCSNCKSNQIDIIKSKRLGSSGRVERVLGYLFRLDYSFKCCSCGFEWSWWKDSITQNPTGITGKLEKCK